MGDWLRSNVVLNDGNARLISVTLMSGFWRESWGPRELRPAQQQLESTLA